MDLEEIFATLTPSRVEQWVSEQQEEHLLLDFKTVTRADFSATDDRRNFAKALSGFANSSGGMIVWGVAAKKLRPDGPDVAVSTGEIDDVPLFISRLNEYTGMFVRPLVEGVRHRPVKTKGKRGFVVTIVPESASGPHMALGGEGRYFKRSGSSFYPMEHFDIEDMFGRRSRPQLRVVTRIVRSGTSTRAGATEYPRAIIVGIENAGRGSARDLFVQLRLRGPYYFDRYGIDGNGNEGMPRLPGGSQSEVSFGGASGLVLHPGMRHDVAAASFTLASRTVAIDDCSIHASIAADGVPLHTQSLVLTGDSVLDVILDRRA